MLIIMLGFAFYLSYIIINSLGDVGVMLVTLFFLTMVFSLYLFIATLDYLHDYISNQNKINFNNTELFTILLYLIGPIYGWTKKEKEEDKS